jgi:hypothetical protein
MTAKHVLVKRLHFRIFPTLDGETFQDGTSLFVNGRQFPERWSREDWEEVEPGTRLEFIYHVSYRLGGVVTEVDWEGLDGKNPFLQIVDGEFQGSTRELERGSMGRYGRFQVLTYQWAKVEPDWILPKDIAIPWKVYQSILTYLDGWEPFQQLSLSELWQCVKHAVDCPISWSFENLLNALSVEGNFVLPPELRRTHDALRLASRIKERGWPLEEEEESPEPRAPEILNLWFDLAGQSWLWVAPDSVFEDMLGLSCAQFTKGELDQEVPFLALKLLFPSKEPFFSVKGQVFESTSGPF